jgi:hypothetical protein
MPERQGLQATSQDDREVRIQAAILAYRNKEIKSITKVAAYHNIPRTTLQDRLRGACARALKQPQPKLQVLTDTQERAIIQ